MRTCGMKVLFGVFSLVFLVCGLSGQQKYALVIGNAAYTTISPLRNTVNDAQDMKAALEGLGFQVDLVKDGNLETLEAAVERLGANLYRSPGSYGFFYYAGHGVQSGGENYLIPVNAAVRTEARLRYEAVHLQYVLDELRNAGNALNLVVLDACRDNPFPWAPRSTMRGLTVIGNQPPGSIIVYATSAGSTASDGEGRNGVFTGELLKQLKTPGLEVKDLFNRTAAAVQRTSEYRQNPAVYLQFFESAWLGAAPAPVVPPVPQPNWTAASDFDLSLEGNGLTITKYKGKAAVVHIPAQVDGIPVTVIGERAFDDCSSLERITIPSSVTVIGYSAFYGCSSLKSITIPGSVTAIGDLAFDDCSSLESITIPSSVTAIGVGAFADCSSLTSITVDSGNKRYSSVNGILFSKDGKTLECYPVGKVFTSYTIPNSVTAIGDWAFTDCSSLERITIPNSVTAIGNVAFASCSSLKSITIPSSVTAIGYQAFYGCRSLKSITIPNSVTAIGTEAFKYCSSLEGITIPSSVTAIGKEAFRGCSRLESIAIPNSVTAIGDWAFSGCSSLERITIPSSVTAIGRSAFSGCSSLESITIPSSVMAIEYRAFSGCSSLESITIPNSVTAIGDEAFSDCSSLESITISSSVTAIGRSAFSGCSSLERITIPSSVTAIGDRAFRECDSLSNADREAIRRRFGDKVF